MDTTAVFAKNLRRLKKQRHISVGALSMSLDVSERQIKSWLAGQYLPRLECALLVAGFFDTTVDDLFREDAHMNAYTQTIITELIKLSDADVIRGIHAAGVSNTTTSFAAKDKDLKNLKDAWEKVFGGRVIYPYIRQTCEIYAQQRSTLKALHKL